MFLKKKSQGKEKGTHYIFTCARERGKREGKGEKRERKGLNGQKGRTRRRKENLKAEERKAIHRKK